jgi:quercetin dioxygenase-like cupin family protein
MMIDRLTAKLIVAGATALALVLAAPFAQSFEQTSELGKIELPGEMVFKGQPGAPQFATVFGDPAKPGIYVQRVKISPGSKLLPHSHPDQPRTVAVMSGTLHFAFGETWDESKLQALPPGAFFTEPPNVAHFAWAKDGEVELQLTSVGPTGTAFVKDAAKN